MLKKRTDLNKASNTNTISIHKIDFVMNIGRKAYPNFVKGLRNPILAFKFIASIMKGYSYRLKYEKILKKATFGKRFRIRGRLKIIGPGKIIFGDDVRCAGTVTPHTHRPEAVIKIGDGVFLNGTRFGAAKLISVGSKCILADCRIMDTDFHSLSKDRHSPDAPVEIRPVYIGNNVWIGAQVGILKGVHIGDNSVIGFGSIVTTDLESNVVAMGNPAKVLKKIPD